MPDLKEKYSDPALDPANKASDNIFNRPDMRALDDQGDAIARDLEGSEKGAKAPRGITGADASDEAARNAEADAASNGLYNPSGKPTQTSGGGWSRRRKLTTIGAGGGIAGIVIAGFMALLPMKLIGVMDSIIGEAGQRVEQVTERRAKTILARAILTKFGVHTGVVITGEGAFSSLVASMRTSGLEKRLAAKGLVITETPDGVKLTQNGKPLGGGKSLKNEADVLDALEKNKVSNKVLKQIVREDIPSWRWMKRAKFAKWLRYKYDIPRYGILNNSEEKDDDKRAKDIQKSRLSEAYKRVAANAIAAFDCILGSKCVADNVGDSNKGDLPSSDGGSEISNDINDAGKTLTDESIKNPFKQVTTKLSTLIVDKLGTKAIPIIGWIDLIATLDHIAYEAFENDYFAKIPAYFRGLQYAQMFGAWSGYSDQQKLGALDHAATGPLANQLDGAETAQAFNYIDGDASVGIPIKLKVNSNQPSEYQKVWKDYQSTMGSLPFSPGGKSSHFLLNLYYETIGGGGLLGFIGEHLGGWIGGVIGFLTPQAAQDWLLGAVQKGLSKAMDIFGLTIDPLDAGPDLFNNLHAGGTVSFNDYCHEIGCRKLSPQQASLSNATIAEYQAEDMKEKGWAYALFSPDNTKSVTTQLAISLPSSGNLSFSTLGTELASFVANIPTTISSTFGPKANANTSYVDLYGVDPYGATEADLNEALSEAFVTGDECPEVSDGSFDSCSIDNEVAAAMECDFKPESAECVDTDVPAASSTSGGGSQFRVASFNLETLKGPSDDWKTRLRRSVEFARANSLEVIGAQETEQAVQYNLAKSNDYFGKEYDVYPTEHMGESAASSRPIFYKRDRFEFVKGDQVAYPRMARDYPGIRGNRAQPAYAPIVWLRDKATQQMFIVMNTHNAAYKFYADERYKSGIAYRDKIIELRKENLPIIFTGDFNEGFNVQNDGPGTTYQGKRENLNYCVLTANKLMKLGLDDLEGEDGTCPRTTDSAIDSIYVSPEVNVTKYEKLAGGHSISGSDHRFVTIADVVIPGEGTLSDLTVATYNVKVPGQTDGPSDGWLHSSIRMPMIAEIVKKYGFEVIGFQEVEPGTFKLLSDTMPEYDSYPKNAASAVDKSWMDPVFWLKDRFTLVEKGEFKRSYRLCPGVALCESGVWVRLKDNSSGKEFYFMSLHMVNRNPYFGPNKSDNGGAEKREADAKEVVRIIKSEFDPGVPVFFVGDLNSSWKISKDDDALRGNRNRLPYCILTENNVLVNSFDAVVNKTGHCPTVNAKYEIDHIYVTPDVKIASAKQIRNEQTRKASDHDPIVAKVAAGGSEGNAAGEWFWPLGKAAFQNHRSAFLDSHYAGGGFIGDGNSSVDISWGDSDTGVPIYSMLDGVVKTQPLGRSSYNCGDPSIRNNGGMMIESTINGKVVQIVYAHGSNPQFGVNDTVRAGRQILKMGNVGNSCGSHLHMNMTYGGRNICLQDVFLALEKNQKPDLDQLVNKATDLCAGRL